MGVLFAVYGVFMVPLGWNLAALAIGWALADFIAADFVKIYFYRRLEGRGLIRGERFWIFGKSNQINADLLSGVMEKLDVLFLV